MTRPRASIAIVFSIVFIDLVGFGIVIPILPLYGERLASSPLQLALLMSSFSAMQFLFAPLLGRLSDRIGRRPILLVSLLGSAAGYLLFGFAGSLGMLFASRIIDGISGANISTAQAVISDITTPEERAKGMGLIGAAFGLGFVLGPAIGGFLVGIAPWLPGVAAAIASLVAFTLVLLILPETIDPEARATARRHGINPRSLKRALAHPLVGLCLVLVLFLVFSFSQFEATFSQWTHHVLGFDERGVSFLFVYVGVLMALIQGGLVGRLARRIGEPRLVLSGAVLTCLALGLLPYQTSLGSTMAVLGLLALGQGLASPALSSLVSKLVDRNEVGGVMGIYQSLSSLGRIGGPFVGQLLFGLGLRWPFRVASLGFLGASGLAVLLLLGSKTHLTDEPVS